MEQFTEPTFFSVIIPTYNRAEQIVVALQSVLAQTFHAFEVVVVDDGSQDNTKDIVTGLQDSRIQYVYQSNSGVAHARNAGAWVAKGKYLVFLDSDDVLTPGYLEKLHVGLADGQRIIGFGFARYIDETGREIAFVQPGRKGRDFGPPLAGAFAIEKTFFEATGGYDVDLSYSENTEFFLRLHQSGKLTDAAVYLATGEGVVVNFRNSRERFNAYSRMKFKSIGHFLKKHAQYFAGDRAAFVNYKTIYAVAAFQNGESKEARRAIAQVIQKKPFRFKAYFQYVLFAIPVLGKTYWKKSS
jgi:glycosyltransferase involved in cell wall biosynthesis